MAHTYDTRTYEAWLGTGSEINGNFTKNMPLITWYKNRSTGREHLATKTILNNTKMADSQQLIAAVRSDPGPQPGQSHRSSGNFSTDNAASSATSFLFKIDQSNPKWESIHFDVMQDVSGGTDPVIYTDVYDGNRESVVRQRSLYIANPAGADSDFTVEVYQVR